VVAEDVLVSVPIADGFVVVTMPEGAETVNGRVQFTIPQIPLGESVNTVISLESPASYVDTLITGYYAESDDLVRAYGSLQILTMSGGSISIATARALAGSTVSIEGVAVMYAGGLYAGSTGTKFYIEDETGGVQIFAPGGIDDVQIAIGDRVRVTGVVTPYRDSIEIIPDDFMADIEILEQGVAWESSVIPIADYSADDEVIGRLNTIEGTAVRIEEFAYSYEIDIADEVGNITLLYIDKLTGVSAEAYEVGSQYRVTGISEYYSGRYQIYPRLQGDIAEVFPPVLAVVLTAPNSIPVDDVMDITITVHNYTDEPMTNIQIHTNPPEGATLGEILDGGILESGTIFWHIDELAGAG
ncbi:MAG: hypothetical protein GY943_25645, partial [Chloroflexi bacterium]|nr:hypothetical protein [Chloroflexota bacterium]